MQYWNASTTGLSVSVPIDGTDPSLVGGYVRLLARANPASAWITIPGLFGISADDLGTNNIITILGADFEGLSCFSEGANITITAVIGDNASNETIGTPSADIITVAMIVPTVTSFILTSPNPTSSTTITFTLVASDNTA